MRDIRPAGGRIKLRPVRETDCQRFWEWANEIDTRAASFSTEPIPWESHVPWFHEKLNDPNCRMYVACTETGRPVGQVRFDIDGSKAVISVSVEAGSRGRGYGTAVLRQAVGELFSTGAIDRIEAYVKPDNAVSICAFASVGFLTQGRIEVKGQPALRMTLGPPQEGKP
jgi:RimJ/RimL family protein N-acetyltransferase